MKKVSLTRVYVGATIAASAIVAPIAAFAATALDNITSSVDSVASHGGIKTSTNDPAALVGNYISAALGLLGVILVVIVIYAGFLWMTAQGNDEKVKQAKKMLSNAVIGMILIFAAYAITTFVVSALKTATTTS